MSSVAQRRPTLLLVDDEEDILLELAEMLESEGFPCHTATSVSLALACLQQHPDVALVMTDLRMPEESGLRLVQRLREQPQHRELPIIVTSGHADMEDVIDVLRLHVTDFFRKPIYHERLLETLDKLFPRSTVTLAQ